MPGPSHFTISGFPVRIHPFFLVVLALLASQGGTSTDALVRSAQWVVVVTISIIWHELGHAFAMRRYGFAPFIELTGLGGLTHWGEGPRATPRARILVSLAGPMAGFVLGGAVWGLGGLVPESAPAWVPEAVELAVWFNLGWGAINLLPMLPWDGGLAAQAGLEVWLGEGGRRASGALTLVVALVCGCAVFVWGEQRLWLLFLLTLSVAEGVRALRPRKTEDPADFVEAMGKHFEALGAGHMLRLIVCDKRTPAYEGSAEHLQSRAGTQEPLRARALELAGWAFLLAGRVDAAARVVQGMEPYRPSQWLAACLALEEGRYVNAMDDVDPDDDEPGAVLVWMFSGWMAGRQDEVLARRDPTGRELLLYALFHREHFDEAAELGERCFAESARPLDAYNAGCSHSRAGRPQEALRCLTAAIDAGYDRPEELDADPDYDTVRTLSGYAELRCALDSD